MNNPTKVLVRKQPMINNHYMRSQMPLNSNLMSKPPPPQYDYRSVKEREEDYNRARERIFLPKQDLDQSIPQNQKADNEEQSQKSATSTQNMLYVPSQEGQLQQQGLVNSGSSMVDGQKAFNNQKNNANNMSSGSLNQQNQQQLSMINSSGNISQGSSQTGNNNNSNNRKNRKAVFRNKEQELQDPDYRRGIERFMPAYEDGHKQNFYMMPNYGTEFPALGQIPQYVPYNPNFPMQQGMGQHQQHPMMGQQPGLHPGAQGYIPHPQILQQQQMQAQHQGAPHQQQGQLSMQQPQLVPMQTMLYPSVQGHPGPQQQQYPQQAFIQTIPLYPHQMQHNQAQQQFPQMGQQTYQQAPSVHSDSSQPGAPMTHPQMQPQVFFYPPQNQQMAPGLQMMNPQQFPMDFNFMQQNPHLANQFMMAQQQPGSRGGSVSGRNSNHGSSQRGSYKQGGNRNNVQYQQFQQSQASQQQLQYQSVPQQQPEKDKGGKVSEKMHKQNSQGVDNRQNENKDNDNSGKGDNSAAQSDTKQIE